MCESPISFAVAILTLGVENYSWSAVARGAVICGLQNIQIQSRQARRNYGIATENIFDPKVHPVEDKVWCYRTEQWQAKNGVQWFVEKVLRFNCVSQEERSSPIYAGG